jgi:putative ABC transport system permease protein
LAIGKAYGAELGVPYVVAELHLGAAAEAIAVTLFFCLLAAVFPAWRSAKMAPAQAIRFDPSVSLVKGSVPWLERALGAVLPLSSDTKISLRNLFRNRRRTLTTALGFIFAFIVLLACWSLFDGMTYMMDVQFQQTDLWDIHASFSRPMPEALVEQIRSWPGVEAVEPVIEAPARLMSASGAEDTLLTAIDADTQLHRFRVGREHPTDPVLAPGNALIPIGLAEELDVVTGDEITIQTLLGSHKVRVDASNQELMGGGAYLDLGWVQEQAGGLEVFTGLLLQVQSADRD